MKRIKERKNQRQSKRERLKRNYRPERTCLGCGVRDDKGNLLRLVATPSGELMVDQMGTGRGGYLHEKETCWETFLGKKKLYRAFHLEIGREARGKLIQGLRDRCRENGDG
ncbi:MAG: YlxR family protein [Deltaproteobacteria bacterium]|nr:YlxR family protein [Deltaproteobacteria bacterium]